MKPRKILKRLFILLFLIIIIAFAWLALVVFPTINGYGAKNMCSAIYLQNRLSSDVKREDLSDFPKSLARFTINEKDSSITASVLGLAKRKAIYRSGCGCTLINDFSEKEIRSQNFSLPQRPVQDADSIPWPAGDQVADSMTVAIDRDLLRQAMSHVMAETTANGEPAYTRAVIVLYDGKIVGEQYAPGFDKNTVMLGWSVSKSLIAAMIGLLVREKRLSVDQPAPVPEWAGTEKNNITIRHLLQHTTGIDFVENYGRPSSVTKMLFSKGDMAAYTASLSLKHKPGTVFNYSSGNTNILSKVIRQVVGEKEYAAFPYQELFYKINAYSFLLEPDASGTYIGSSYSYATARDFARFGLLYYNNGKWNGQQLLPENWIAESIRPAEADPQKHYGYQFWLNGYDLHDTTKRWYPDVPADMYFADGYGGQDIYIIPSKKLVVVRLGVQVVNENRFLKDVIQAIR